LENPAHRIEHHLDESLMKLLEEGDESADRPAH